MTGSPGVASTAGMMRGAGARGYGGSDRTLVLMACCFASFIAPLLGTMINLSLVSIGQEFGVGSHDLAYVNTSFLLSSVVFMVPIARVGDIYGKRRVFLAGVAVIAVASMMAVFTPSFSFLIACRVMMGAGAAAISTTSISMIADVFPADRRGGAIGLQTMCNFVGLAAGPPIGGALDDVFGWHSLFLLIVPMAMVAVLSMWRFRHEIRPDEGGRFDSRGSVLYGAGIMLSMLGMVNLPESWAVLSLVAGVAVMACFVLWQLRCPHHVLDVRLFRKGGFSGPCLAMFLIFVASNSIPYFMALYLQSIGGLSSMQAGMMMLLQPAVQSLGTPLFGRVSDRIGDKRLLPTAGMLITALGVSTVMLYGTVLSTPLVLATMLTVGFGLSVFSAPNTSVIMGAVEPDETGEASAMVMVMRQMGIMVSMGIAMLFISVIMGSADSIVSGTYGDFVEVLRCSFAVCTAACMVGAVAVFRGGSAEGR